MSSWTSDLSWQREHHQACLCHARARSRANRCTPHSILKPGLASLPRYVLAVRPCSVQVPWLSGHPPSSRRVETTPPRIGRTMVGCRRDPWGAEIFRGCAPGGSPVSRQTDNPPSACVLHPLAPQVQFLRPRTWSSRQPTRTGCK